MSSGRSDRGSSRHSAGLLLRVHRPDGGTDEFYLAGGLTIGRSLANTVVLADDDSVDRTHACVEIADDGSARLRCVEPDSSLTIDEKAVRDLPLDPGSRFRIGRTEFECIPGRRWADRPDDTVRTACPFCASTDVATGGEDIQPCPACEGLILPVRPDSHGAEPIFLPAVYGDYRAERYVARGGMGLVLKGVRVGGTEPVAVKVLLPGTLADRRDAELFEREVAMLARVRHPHVVKLLDHGKSGRFHFLVLEWIEGPSLRQVIADANRAGKVTDFTVAFRWFEQVSKGLAAIHAVGMVHRDIKPSNILIGPDGVARIADLGIAKRIDAAHTSYTTTGHAPGTFEYMAPEQLAAPDTVDGRTDLYALGLTFYELLTRVRPVGPWRPASDINETVPKVFDEILGHLLAPTPDQRFGDIHELLSDLSMIRHPFAAERHLQATSGDAGSRVFGVSVPPAAKPSPERGLTKVLHGAGRHPWPPWIIGLGMILFGPIWVGVMTALNWRRLSSPRIVWRPVVIGLAATCLSLLAGFLFPSGWSSGMAFCLLDLPALGLLTATDLLPQHRNYRAYRASGGRVGGWVLPVVLGIPVIAVMLAVIWVDRAAPAYQRGVAAAGQGDNAAAIIAFSEAIRLDPDDVETYRARAGVYLDKGDYDQALADYAEVIRRDPGDANAYHMRGGLFMGRGDYDLAIVDCNESIRRDPAQAAAYLKP